MSYTQAETNEKRAEIAMELLRYLMLREIADGRRYASIEIEKLNEVLLVGGQPLVVPEEVKAPEVKVIDIDRNEEDEA